MTTENSAPDVSAISSLADLDAAQAARGEDGRRYFEADSRYRHAIEQQRAKIFAGETITQKAEATGRDNLAQFNAEMRSKGLQRTDVPLQEPGGVDQRALEKLNELRAQKGTKADPAWLAQWERDVAAVMEGRRLDESLAEFRTRQQTESLPVQATVGEIALNLPADTELTDTEGLQRVVAVGAQSGVSAAVIGEVLQAAAAVGVDAGAEDFTDSDFQLYGYTISPAAIGEGHQLNRNSTQLHAVCKAARASGIPEKALTAMLKTYFAEAS